MFIRVPNEVVKLAEIFQKKGEKLYLVGGYIRNQLLGIKDDENIDIDVCSSCLPEKVLKILENSPFEANYMSKEMGVVEIKNTLRVEHATFRKETYEKSGAHTPTKVEFIKDLEEDALRRDFRCNAIYYDIIGDEIVDPLDGVGDTAKRIIRTTLKPDEVFKSDGERVLRMVRFAATLGFKIDDKTFESAKRHASRLADISMSRKREEFSRIVLADTEYPFLPDKKYAHARGLNMLAELDAIKYIMPVLDEIRLSGLIEDRKKPLFEHIMNVFAFSAPEVRLSALLHDVGKARAYAAYGNFNGEEEYAPVIIEKTLGNEGLGYSKKIVERVKRVVLGNNFNKRGFENAKNIRHFIVDNFDCIELIIKLKNAIAQDKSNNTRRSKSAEQINKIYIKMQNNNAPITLDKLAIKGDVLIKSFPELKVNRTSELLKALQYKCVDVPTLNTEKCLLELAEKMIHKKNSIFVR